MRLSARLSARRASAAWREAFWCAVGEVAQPLLELLLEKTKKLKIGDGRRPGTDMGPLVTAEHHKRVSGYVEKGLAEGAVALCDGRRNGPGRVISWGRRFSTTSRRR